ncbi:hypothetical protein [Phytohabitans suffuscus]|uniref:Uncharacterized protein n=1 Tax=Phytohabitans suffuscus TaxID=624315 RepID=A0A6F8YER9_9ACTN|nr:hypothetical protein [Phytohabitans suffuscus]BCB84441.1 hypothetical protein Psuf_017540 [Phytohabitans suffuscus]
MSERLPGEAGVAQQVAQLGVEEMSQVQPQIEGHGLFGRLRNKLTSLIAVGAAAVAVTAAPAIEEEAANANAAASAVIGMPFEGRWGWNVEINPPYSDDNSSHPSVHHTPGGGDWAADIYAAAGKEVKLKATSSGNLSFTWGSASGSCGESRRVNVFVDESQVGWMYVTHLTNAASTASAPTEGMTIGKIANLSCNPGGSAGKHVHLEFKNISNHSCYTDNGKAGVLLSEGVGLGKLGSSNSSPRQACAATPPPPPTPNEGVVTLPGNWSGDAREDFAYITKREGSGGFDFAVMETTAAGLAWRGLWWTVDSLKFDTTKFLPADTDGDGRLDLLYASPREGAFDMALMHNNGNGFSWWGQQWNPNLDLTKTKFLPGNWSGDSRQEFAYITKRDASGGFDLGVMEMTNSGLSWGGTRWTEEGLKFDTTKFVPADQNNDGRLDLFYASPRTSGFDMALMRNNGSSFTWIGHQWNPGSLDLAKTRFIPGNWGGDGAGDFAYVTPRGDGGFDLAAFISTPAGIVWQERLHEPSLAFNTVQFVPANVHPDQGGYTDLYYVTPNGTAIDMALFENNGASFNWAGQRWNPQLQLGKIVFLPKG